MSDFNWGDVGGHEMSALDAKDKFGVNVGPYIDFGAMPRFSWTEKQQQATHDALKRMPKFAISGNSDPGEKKVCLFDLWRHQETVSALGYVYPGIRQITGSCVGAGFGNVAFSLCAMEVIRLKDPEQIMIPFWLFTYGRGRLRAGMSSPGEGSNGAPQAEAARLDGLVEATRSGLPSFSKTDGLSWGSSTEMSWSDGDARQSIDMLPEARKHLIKTTAKLNSADDVRAAIRDGKYPVTQASMYGFNARVEGEGQDAVLIGRRGPRWAHQMSIHGWWEHPKFGELFWMQNQWGLNAHGTDPSGGPLGGVWIPKNDVDWLINDGDECFAFSQFSGFPSQQFSWGEY